jgi:hypothetical protein
MPLNPAPFWHRPRRRPRPRLAIAGVMLGLAAIAGALYALARWPL